MFEQKSPLVSAAELNTYIHNEHLIILDASQAQSQNLKVNDAESQIVGAHWFDLKGIFSDPSSYLPATMPSTEQFERGCQSLGINQSSVIVVYDNAGVYFSPRVWWMFKSMGHEQVYVLDGGLQAWMGAGCSVESNREGMKGMWKGDFQAHIKHGFVNAHFVASKINSPTALIIDARAEDRYNGSVQESRPGLRSGHIPSAVNIPFDSMLSSGRYKSKVALKALINKFEVKDRALIFYCGSGVTACIVLLAFAIAGLSSLAVYDGSWTEWGSIEDFQEE